MEKYVINWLPPDNFLFSLIQDSQQHYEKLVLNNYIDIECNLKFGYAINTFSQMYQYSDFQCFQIVQVRLDQLGFLHNSLEGFIKNAIDHGYSLLIPINTFYINQYKTSGRRHISHEINIDNYEEDYYYCKDFFDYKRYENKKCLQIEVEKAILNYGMVDHVSPNYNMVGLKLKNHIELDIFNIRKLYNGLNYFMSSDKPVNDVYYGISWFEGIITDLSENAFRDYKILELHFLLEHMRLMNYRLFYLIEIRKISSLKSALDDLLKLENRIENQKLKWMRSRYYKKSLNAEDKLRKETINEFKYFKEQYGKLISLIVRGIIG